jgi:hypothetical protein
MARLPVGIWGISTLCDLKNCPAVKLRSRKGHAESHLPVSGVIPTIDCFTFFCLFYFSRRAVFCNLSLVVIERYSVIELSPDLCDPSLGLTRWEIGSTSGSSSVYWDDFSLGLNIMCATESEQSFGSSSGNDTLNCLGRSTNSRVRHTYFFSRLANLANCIPSV